MAKTAGKDLQDLSNKTEQQLSVITRGIHFSGPLPPPTLLEGYDRVVPGAAERLISLVEADAKHQRDLESNALSADASATYLGQILGCIVVLAALAIAGFCAYFDHEAAASTIGGTTVISLATCFVLGRKKDIPQKSTRKKK